MDFRIGPLKCHGRFYLRRGRFAALCKIGRPAVVVPVRIPNAGRLSTLLVPGRECLLAEGKPSLPYTIYAARMGAVTVCLDSTIARALFLWSVRYEGIREIDDRADLDRSPVAGGSHHDFLARAGRDKLLVDVRTVSRAKDRIAYYPDVPAARDLRQVRALESVAVQGHPAAVFFLVLRHDVDCLALCEATDPVFCQVLRQAVMHGVAVKAYRYSVHPQTIGLPVQIPVILD